MHSPAYANAVANMEYANSLEFDQLEPVTLESETVVFVDEGLAFISVEDTSAPSSRIVPLDKAAFIDDAWYRSACVDGKWYVSLMG